MSRNARASLLVILFVMGAFVVVYRTCRSDNCSIFNSSSQQTAALEGSSTQIDELVYAHHYNLMTDAMVREWEAKLAAGTAQCTLGKYCAKLRIQQHPS